MPVYVNPYLQTADTNNENVTFVYVIFKDFPLDSDYGQYVFQPNDLSNQFPGRHLDDNDLDLYSWVPSNFAKFEPYEYKIRRDITLQRHRRIYISNIAMHIGNHSYARTNWDLRSFDSQCKTPGGGGNYTFQDMRNDYGSGTHSQTMFDRRSAWFIPACNDQLWNPPWHKNGRTKAEFWDDLSAVGKIHHIHYYSDAKTGAGSDHWSGKWGIGNYNPDNPTGGWHTGATSLMSPANVGFGSYMRALSGYSFNSRHGPVTVTGGSNDYEWRYTQILPLESPIRAVAGTQHSAAYNATTTYDEDKEKYYTVDGLEAQGIHDLFSQTFSTDNPSLSGEWYICVHQEADGWEWKIVNWSPGWHAVNRERRWECFKIPKQHYLYNWFDLVDSYNLGRATGGSDSPQNYTYQGRTYVRHYGKNVSWTSTHGSWVSQTYLDSYMAVGSMPPTTADIERIGSFSKYHSDFMGWINPEAPHATLNPNQPFRFYNPFRNDGSDSYYNLLDLTGVKKPNGERFKMVSHVKKIQQQFQPIVTVTTTNGLIETQRWYEAGLDSGYELVSAPAEVEFSVDIKSNRAFFPDASWNIDNKVYSLSELKEEYGLEFKFFITDWGDSPTSANYEDSNMDGLCEGCGDSRVDFPQSISEYNALANKGQYIVFNHDQRQKHTYYEENQYVISGYVMCVKTREINNIVEDMVIAMKKVETRIRIEKEFIFYPDYLHLGEGDYPIIPWTSGVAPIISGISDRSDYKDSLRKVLGSSTFVFSDAREYFLKGKTKKAYKNDELGEFLGKTDIGQIRYFTKPYDINYMLGLSQTTYNSANLRVERGNCEHFNLETQEYEVLNDRIYGDSSAIPFFMSLHPGTKIHVAGFYNDVNNTALIFDDVEVDGHDPFIVDGININTDKPYISIRSCEYLYPGTDGVDGVPTGTPHSRKISNANVGLKNNVTVEKELIPETYICWGSVEHNSECNQDNIGAPCGIPTENQRMSWTSQVCIQDYNEEFRWNIYSNENYWNGIENSFATESATTSIFINESYYKILKDSCIVEFNFDDNDGITIRDSSGNQNNGIIIGDYGLLKVAEDVPMGLGSSVKKPNIRENDDGVL